MVSVAWAHYILAMVFLVSMLRMVVVSVGDVLLDQLAHKLLGVFPKLMRVSSVLTEKIFWSDRQVIPYRLLEYSILVRAFAVAISV